MSKELKLNYKKKVIIELVDHEFSTFVSEYYGNDFEFVADQEAGNDSSHSFNIQKKEELDQYDNDRLDAFKNNGDYMFLSHTILQDLVNKDELPSGEFIISVCW